MKYFSYLNSFKFFDGCVITEESIKDDLNSFSGYFPEKVFCDLYVGMYDKLMQQEFQKIEGTEKYIKFIANIVAFYDMHGFNITRNVLRLVEFIEDNFNISLVRLENYANESVEKYHPSIVNHYTTVLDVSTKEFEEIQHIPIEMANTLMYSNDPGIEGVLNTTTDKVFGTMKSFSDIVHISKGSLALPWTGYNIAMKRANTEKIEDKQEPFKSMIVVLPSYYMREFKGITKYIGALLLKAVEDFKGSICIHIVSENGVELFELKNEYDIIEMFRNISDNKMYYRSNAYAVKFIESMYINKTIHYFPDLYSSLDVPVGGFNNNYNVFVRDELADAMKTFALTSGGKIIKL